MVGEPGTFSASLDSQVCEITTNPEVPPTADAFASSSTMSDVNIRQSSLWLVMLSLSIDWLFIGKLGEVIQREKEDVLREKNRELEQAFQTQLEQKRQQSEQTGMPLTQDVREATKAAAENQIFNQYAPAYAKRLQHLRTSIVLFKSLGIFLFSKFALGESLSSDLTSDDGVLTTYITCTFIDAVFSPGVANLLSLPPMVSQAAGMIGKIFTMAIFWYSGLPVLAAMTASGNAKLGSYFLAMASFFNAMGLNLPVQGVNLWQRGLENSLGSNPLAALITFPFNHQFMLQTGLMLSGGFIAQGEALFGASKTFIIFSRLVSWFQKIAKVVPIHLAPMSLYAVLNIFYSVTFDTVLPASLVIPSLVVTFSAAAAFYQFGLRRYYRGLADLLNPRELISFGGNNPFVVLERKLQRFSKRQNWLMALVPEDLYQKIMSVDPTLRKDSHLKKFALSYLMGLSTVLSLSLWYCHLETVFVYSSVLPTTIVAIPAAILVVLALNNFNKVINTKAWVGEQPVLPGLKGGLIDFVQTAWTVFTETLTGMFSRMELRQFFPTLPLPKLLRNNMGFSELPVGVLTLPALPLYLLGGNLVTLATAGLGAVMFDKFIRIQAVAGAIADVNQMINILGGAAVTFACGLMTMSRFSECAASLLADYAADPSLRLVVGVAFVMTKAMYYCSSRSLPTPQMPSLKNAATAFMITSLGFAASNCLSATLFSVLPDMSDWSLPFSVQDLAPKLPAFLSFN